MTGLLRRTLSSFGDCQHILLCCCPSTLPCCRAVGTYADLRTAIRERDLAVLAVHGRKERNPAAPATLRPVSSYSDQEVKATAAALQQRVCEAGQAWVTLMLAAASCAWPKQCSSRLLGILGGTASRKFACSLLCRIACRASIIVVDTSSGDNTPSSAWHLSVKSRLLKGRHCFGLLGVH